MHPLLYLDFSGRVDVPDRHGYRAEPSSYEVSVVDREPETLIQRYQRLKGEVAELASDLEKVKESQQSSEKLLEVSPAHLLQDVSLSNKDAQTLNLELNNKIVVEFVQVRRYIVSNLPCRPVFCEIIQ